MSNRKLSATIVIGGGVASSLTSAIGGTTSKLKALGTEIGSLTRRQKLLGESIQVFGKMGKDVDSLRGKYAQTTTELGRMRREFERLQTAQARAKSIGGFVSASAMGIGAGALAAGAVSKPLIGAAIERENVINAIRNSGLSKDDADGMIKAAEGSKQFGVSVTKAADTLLELRTALGDAHHAIEALPSALKAVSGLKLYDRLHHTDLASGDSAYQLAKIAEERGGANSPEALREKQNWAFKTITGTGGKITANDILTSVRSGKGGVRAMSDEAFFGDAFLMQAMGADRYGTSSSSLTNAWIGGHQTHGAFDHMMQMGLLNKKGVKLDKTGKVKTVAPDALVDAQMFLKDPQAWVEKHLVPLAKSRGVDLDDEAKVMAFVNAIASNQNAANLLLNRILGRSSIAKDRRNVMQASGIDQSDEANRNSSAGKIENARARMNDAEARMGSVLLPTLASAMERAASALEGLNRLADESPGLFKAMTYGMIGLTGALTGLVAVGITSKLATEGLTLATRAYSTAATLASTNTGKLVGGLVGKAGLVFALSAVALEAAKFLGLPDTDKKMGMEDVKNGKWLAASAHLPAADFIREAWNHATGKTPPEVPARAGASGAPVVNDNSQTTIQLYQQPGEDMKAFADRLQRELKKRQAIDARSSMTDGVGVQ